MHLRIQLKRMPGIRGWARWRAGLLAFLAFAFVVSHAAAAQAPGAPLGPVGQIEGSDISVQGPTAAGETGSTGSSMAVGNGSVVIVHAGQARLALLTGGEVDICGPAKFTLLESGGSVTIAVELGRMHVQLPSSATLRLFTPTIVATPLEISGGSRDLSVGLDQDDSLCVLATSGAIQLEHQFSGEKLIVPQSGEFFLNAGKLLPVVGKPGSCRCTGFAPSPQIPEPTDLLEHTGNVPLLTAPLPPAALADKASPGATNSAAPPSVEFSVPAHANEAHPMAPPSAKETAPPPIPQPATSTPVYTVVAPPLTFNAKNPAPPPDPPIDTFLLVREAQVQPGWEFKGHVDPPTFADAMQRALGESATANQPAAQPRKKGGFWGFWRRIF